MKNIGTYRRALRKKGTKKLRWTGNKKTPAKPETLVIYYLPSTNLRPETFHNIKNPEPIIRRRNAIKIEKVNYGGKRYDISKFQDIYPQSVVK